MIVITISIITALECMRVSVCVRACLCVYFISFLHALVMSCIFALSWGNKGGKVSFVLSNQVLVAGVQSRNYVLKNLYAFRALISISLKA